MLKIYELFTAQSKTGFVALSLSEELHQVR